jgi:hypothetical protein
MRWRYRLHQFVMRLRPRITPADQRLVRETLHNEAYALFQRMPAGDQAHAVCVWRQISGQNSADSDLAYAALLHDVGKAGAGLTLGHRVIIVLVGALGRARLEKLAVDDPTSWRYPFFVHLRHAEIGAAACERAVCPPRVVDLIRYHDAPKGIIHHLPYVDQLMILREADDLC